MRQNIFSAKSHESGGHHPCRRSPFPAHAMRAWGSIKTRTTMYSQIGSERAKSWCGPVTCVCVGVRPSSVCVCVLCMACCVYLCALPPPGSSRTTIIMIWLLYTPFGASSHSERETRLAYLDEQCVCVCMSVLLVGVLGLCLPPFFGVRRVSPPQLAGQVFCMCIAHTSTANDD